jgi:hypothetical protein
MGILPVSVTTAEEVAVVVAVDAEEEDVMIVVAVDVI